MFDLKILKMFAILSQIGTAMLVPIFVMLGIGLWIDEKFSTRLVLVFLLLGIGAGFRNCFLIVRKLLKEMESSES